MTRFGTAALEGALLVGLAAGCTGSSSDARPRRVETPSGLSVVVPDGWSVQTKDSAGGLSVFYGNKAIAENCNSKRDFTHVSVIFQVATANSGGTYQKRPLHFDSRSGSGVSRGAAVEPCNSSGQIIRFTDHGQHLYTVVDFGARAGSRQRARAYHVLNSLRVKPTR